MPGTALLKHTWGTTIKNDTGAVTLNDTVVILGSNEFNEAVTVPAAATAEIDCGSLPFAKMVSLFLFATGAVTVYTNAADGAGGQVIALAANKGYGWNNTRVDANPITANILKIFVTNAGASPINFKAGFLMNLLA